MLIQLMEINPAGNNVYVTRWERSNKTSNEPVIRISNDNGNSFSEIIKLFNPECLTYQPKVDNIYLSIFLSLKCGTMSTLSSSKSYGYL